MKGFILKEILIMSQPERTAKSVTFHPERTIILGSNDTGKSSLIKSIYSAFGAPAAKENSNWKALNPIILVKFELYGESYSILKDGKYYTIFDRDDELIETFDSVTKGLGPFLAKLFQFNLKLNDQKGVLITPPPAFCFLPFYIDQDAGWQTTWASFKNLSQIKAYKKPSIEFHTGLRPNEFYEKKSEFDACAVEIEELNREKRVAKKVLEKIRNKLSLETFDIDIESFQAEIKQMLVQCQQLKKDQDSFKNKLSGLYNDKINYESQIIIATNAVKELHKDFEFATELHNEVDCPTCGAHYDDLFSERFNIALDENRAEELLLELKELHFSTIETLKNVEESFLKKSKEIEQIETILEEKKGEVKLSDIIEKEGRKELNTIFNADVLALEDLISKILSKQVLLKERLDTLDNKNRKGEIRLFFKDLMKTNLKSLDVTNLAEKDYSDVITFKGNTGSAGARILIAYYFSVFRLIEKYSSSIFCPIIVDSPNQQAQDPEHIDKIYNFIKDNQPNGSQMILGLEELYNVDFGGKIVELTDKYHLLNRENYEIVFPEINRYLKKTYASDLFS